MAILIKLLLIRMVARSVLGNSIKLKIRLTDLWLSDLSFSRSFGERLKKATSEPEIMAELIKRMRTNVIAMAKPKTGLILIGKKKRRRKENFKYPGSGSNKKDLVKKLSEHQQIGVRLCFYFLKR